MIIRFFLFSILVFNSQQIFAQDFPTDIFDTWTVNRELNACNSDITGDTLWGAGVIELEINNLSKDQNIDTTQFIMKYFTGVADTCVFELNGQPDSTNWISSTSYECFEMVAWLNINLVSQDSLHFHWLMPCNACNCGGIFQAQRRTSSLLSEPDFSDKWTVYPNPVSDRVFIKRNGIGVNENLKVNVTNSLGVSLLTFDQLEDDFDFSTAEFAKGVYYILISEGKTSSVKKILKI